MLYLTCTGPGCHRSAFASAETLTSLGWTRTEDSVYCPHCGNVVDKLLELAKEVGYEPAMEQSPP